MRHAFDETFQPVDHLALGSESETWCEHEHTLNTPQNRVWTIVEGDDARLIALPGYHVVYRIYYVVTGKPWEQATPGFDWVDGEPEGA
jgi:hypothetical protein